MRLAVLILIGLNAKSAFSLPQQKRDDNLAIVTITSATTITLEATTVEKTTSAWWTGDVAPPPNKTGIPTVEKLTSTTELTSQKTALPTLVPTSSNQPALNNLKSSNDPASPVAISSEATVQSEQTTSKVSTETAAAQETSKPFSMNGTMVTGLAPILGNVTSSASDATSSPSDATSSPLVATSNPLPLLANFTSGLIATKPALGNVVASQTPTSGAKSEETTHSSPAIVSSPSSVSTEIPVPQSTSSKTDGGLVINLPPIPDVIISAPSLTIPLVQLPTAITLPTIEIPTQVTFPSISLPTAITLPTIEIPTQVTFPSISLPTLSIPSISLPLPDHHSGASNDPAPTNAQPATDSVSPTNKPTNDMPGPTNNSPTSIPNQGITSSTTVNEHTQVTQNPPPVDSNAAGNGPATTSHPGPPQNTDDHQMPPKSDDSGNGQAGPAPTKPAPGTTSNAPVTDNGNTVTQAPVRTDDSNPTDNIDTVKTTQAKYTTLNLLTVPSATSAQWSTIGLAALGIGAVKVQEVNTFTKTILTPVTSTQADGSVITFVSENVVTGTITRMPGATATAKGDGPMATLFQDNVPEGGTTIPITMTNSFIVVVDDNGVTKTLPPGATATGMYDVVLQTVTSDVVVMPTRALSTTRKSAAGSLQMSYRTILLFLLSSLIFVI